MSALLQSPNLFRSLRKITEQEAILTLGKAALTASDATLGLETLAGVALRLSGIHGVVVRLNSVQDALEWHASRTTTPGGTAMGLIAANAREWGNLRLLFEPRTKSMECPLKFARVLAQQAALMLNRLELKENLHARTRAVRRLEQRLDARKAVSRAAGLLAKLNNLTEQHAMALLLRQAREKRSAPLAVARSIILGAETGHLAPIALRRLKPHELTARI